MNEKQEACQLFIEQEIDRGLEQGKTPYTVAKEIIPWLQKLFDVRMKHKTIEKRAERRRDALPTFVGNDLTYCNNNEIEEKPIETVRDDKGLFKEGTAPGPGRPPKFKVEEPAHRTSFTGDNEWYTPVEYIEAAREVMGRIDLDPASTEFGQERVRADRFYTPQTDGLSKEWHGSVWLNPPYSQPLISQFIAKAYQDILSGITSQAIILTHNYTDTLWFHLMESVSQLICFTKGRIKFEKADGTIAAPTQGQAFFYCGKNTERFKEIFGKFGFIR